MKKRGRRLTANAATATSPPKSPSRKALKLKLARKSGNAKIKGPTTRQIDPSGTLPLQRTMIDRLRSQFAAIAGDIVNLVVKQDSFGLKNRKPEEVRVANLPTQNYDPEQPRDDHGRFEEGTSEPSGKAEKDTSPRAEQIRRDAAAIPVTDKTEQEGVGSRDYDEIEARMTSEEQLEMEKSLEETKDSYLNEGDYDTDVSERDVASQINLSPSDVEEKAEELFDQYGIKDKVPSLSYHEYGADGIDKCLDALEGYDASEWESPEELDELKDKLREWRDDAADKLKEAVEEEEDNQRDYQRKQAADDYDEADAKREYLHQFHRDNPERFTGKNCEPGEWCKDSDGDGILKFSTKAGTEFEVMANHRTIGDLHDVPDMQFRSKQGFGITGGGEAFEVFTKAVPAITAYIQKKDIPLATFSAAEPSRQRLYDKLVRTVASVNEGYFAAAVDKGGTRYYLVGKREEKDKVLKATEKWLVGAEPKILVNAADLFEMDLIINEQWWEEAWWVANEPTFNLSAADAYLANYPPGWNLGPVEEMSVEEFKSWLTEEMPRPTSNAVDDVPSIRQLEASCGAAAAMMVGAKFGVGPETQDEWRELVGTTAKDGTHPDEIADALRGLGLAVEARSGMSLRDLREHVASGNPVICPIQSCEEGGQSLTCGHYVVVIGVGGGEVTFRDPQTDAGVSRMPMREWITNWRDVDAGGREFVRYGIAVGPKVVENEQSRDDLGRFSSSLTAEHPSAKIQMEDRGNVLRLDHIETSEHKKGEGSTILKKISAFADKHGKTIQLTPDPSYGTPLSVLKNFYEKHGFKDRGMPSGAMERRPVVANLLLAAPDLSCTFHSDPSGDYWQDASGAQYPAEVTENANPNHDELGRFASSGITELDEGYEKFASVSKLLGAHVDSFNEDGYVVGDKLTYALPGGRYVMAAMREPYSQWKEPPGLKVRIDFGINGQGTKFQNNGIQKESIGLLRFVEKAVKAYHAAGFKIEVSPSDEHRKQFYDLALSKIGLKKSSNEEANYSVWNYEGQPRDDHGRFGEGSSGSDQHVKSIAEKFKAVGAWAGHAEHVTKEWVKDNCEAAVSKLPAPAQTAVRGTYAALCVGVGVAFSAWTANQNLAERVAKERGMTDEQARTLRGTLSTIDIAAFKPIAIATHSFPALAAASWVIPPATGMYLAYSTARDPLAVARAATGMVRDALGKVKEKASDFWLKAHGSGPLVAHNSLRDRAGLIADFVQAHGDWGAALLHAAIDETGDVGDAINLATELAGKTTENSFCPTGEGGGVNATCSPSDKEANAREIAATREAMNALPGKFSGTKEEKRRWKELKAKLDQLHAGQIVESPKAPVNKENEPSLDVGEKWKPTTKTMSIPTPDSRNGSKVSISTNVPTEELAKDASKTRELKGILDLRNGNVHTWNPSEGNHEHSDVTKALSIPEGKYVKLYLKHDEGGVVGKTSDYEHHVDKDLVRVAASKIDRLPFLVTNAGDFEFHTDPKKIEAFQRWLKKQLLTRVIGKSQEALWQAYIKQGYERGAGRSFDDVRGGKKYAKGYAADQSTADFYAGGKEEFLKSSFGQPVSVEKVKLMAGRAFDDLENVTADMSTRMSRVLTDGLVQGKSPHDVAKDMTDVVDISRARAETIARTELIRTHAEGQLTALKQLGVQAVGVDVEFSTALDELVCPDCAALEGTIFDIDDAHGIIPVHPNCRCAFRPSSKHFPTGNRRRMTNNRVWEYLEPTQNTFCPTGEGGGVDATCSPHGVHGTTDEEHKSGLTRAPCCPSVTVPDAENARVGVSAFSVPPPPHDGIPRLPNLTPDQRAVETRFAEAYLKNPDKMVAKYREKLAEGKVGVAPNVYATDDVKMLNRDWNPDKVRAGEELTKDTKEAMAKYNTAVHQTANAIAKKAFVEKLDEMANLKDGDPLKSVLVTNGGCAAGKGSTLSHAAEPDSPYNKVTPAAHQVGAVWDAAGEQNATENEWIHRECLKRGITPTFAYVWANPKDGWDSSDRGVIRRAVNKGRMVDAKLFADSYAEGAKNMHTFAEKHASDGTKFIFIDNRIKGDPKLLDSFPKETLTWDADKINKMAVESLKAHKKDLPKVLVRAGLAGETIWGSSHA